MKIAIVDDERVYLKQMSELCRAFGEKNSMNMEISAFAGGGEFLKAAESENFTVVFMDIYMNGMTGVEAATRLRKRDNLCLIVFLTSSAEFMSEAFSCHAFEYIIKPFSNEKVFKVLKDAAALVPDDTKRLEIYCGRRAVQLPLSEIVSIVSDAHYLNITTIGSGEFRPRLTMRQFFEQACDDPRFIPINKGITVNADFIVGIENCSCMMENGSQLPIRVRDRLNIEQTILNYNFGKIRSRQRYK